MPITNWPIWEAPGFLQGLKPFKKYDIQAFIACVITMSIVELPEESEYWSTIPFLSVPFVTNLFTRDLFAMLKHCFMVANPTKAENAADKLAKVRPFLNLVHRRYFHPHQDCSLDESQC